MHEESYLNHRNLLNCFSEKKLSTILTNYFPFPFNIFFVWHDCCKIPITKKLTSCIKNSYLSAVICLITGSTFAQFNFGIKGGANLNKITGQSFKDQFSWGYHIGGFAEIGLGKKFALQPEVLFNQVNLDTSSKFSSVYQFNKISNVQLKYLSIPLLLDYKAH